jgi:uncharacterized protein
MSLLEQRPEGVLAVRWVRPDAICIEQRELQTSFLLTPSNVIPDWGPTSVDAIDEPALAAIVALQPSVVLVGTGQRQRFLPPQRLAALLTQGIGVESMDNAAAARTFNLLAAEGRNVLAAFLLPG